MSFNCSFAEDNRVMFCIPRFCGRRFRPLLQFAREYKVKAISVKDTPELSLAEMVPDVLKYWDQQRNGNLSPRDIPYNYQGELWWKCPKGADHVWSSKKAGAIDVANRTMRSCPFCGNRKLSTTNSLLTRYPGIALMLDPVLNNGCTANNVIYTNQQRFQWRCDHNHVFRSTIRDLVRKQDEGAVLCSTCRKWETRSMLLAEEYPELFEESYNWLNCPTVRKAERKEAASSPADLSFTSPPLPQEMMDEDGFIDFPFEELYVDSSSSELPRSSPTQSSSSSPSSSLFSSLSSPPPSFPSADPASESLHRVLHNHLVEYRKWRETLRSDDSRIVWWVCGADTQHIWRESVRTRVANQCPFCAKSEKMSKKAEKVLEAGDGKMVQLRTKHSQKDKKKTNEQDISYVLF